MPTIFLKEAGHVSLFLAVILFLLLFVIGWFSFRLNLVTSFLAAFLGLAILGVIEWVFDGVVFGVLLILLVGFFVVWALIRLFSSRVAIAVVAIAVVGVFLAFVIASIDTSNTQTQSEPTATQPTTAASQAAAGPTGGAIAPAQRLRRSAPTVEPQQQLDPVGASRGACGPKNRYTQVPDGGKRFASWLEGRGPGWSRRFLHGNAGLLANRQWFQFKGNTITDVRQWWSDTRVVELTKPATIITSYCTADAVLVWMRVTLQPKERVHVIEVDGYLRIVARAGCKNLALPATRQIERRIEKRSPSTRPSRIVHPPPPPAVNPPPAAPPPAAQAKCQRWGICGTPTTGDDVTSRPSPGSSASAPPRDHAESTSSAQQQGDSSGRTSTGAGTDTGSDRGGAAGQTGADETTGQQGGSGAITVPPAVPPNAVPATIDPCGGDPNNCGG